MNKIMILTSALALDTNREVYKKCMQENMNLYKPDAYVVYDQEFSEDDYLDGFTYIGHQDKRQGFIKPRNELFNYFYNSDFDYAILMDANETPSKTCYNEVTTLMNYLREHSVDCIVSTLGIIIDANRMKNKQNSDYFSKIKLEPIPANNHDCEYLHSCVIANFKKKYNETPLIDEESFKPEQGMFEDIYFVRLLKNQYNVYKLATLAMNKNGGTKSSTWQNNEDGKFHYNKIDYKATEKLVRKNVKSDHRSFALPITIDRIQDEYVNNLKEYKTRSKKI